MLAIGRMTPRAVLSRGRQFAGIGIWRRSENRWRPPDGSSPGYFLNKDQKKGEKKGGDQDLSNCWRGLGPTFCDCLSQRDRPTPVSEYAAPYEWLGESGEWQPTKHPLPQEHAPSLPDLRAGLSICLRNRVCSRCTEDRDLLSQSAAQL